MIVGKWYAAGSSAATDAQLFVIDHTHFSIVCEGKEPKVSLISTLDISNRLGNIERKVFLSDGSLFATNDNDGIDSIFYKEQKFHAFLHSIESHMGWVLVGLVVIVLSTFSFFKWGVPWTSKTLAHALPHQTNKLIATNTLDFLDKFIFKKSKLSKTKIATIQKHFKDKVIPLTDQDNTIVYTLHFRDWSDDNLSIPNALALPSGDIILTDKFVQLCNTQDEMDSVLLHEMGHVVYRHTLEMVIEGTFISVAIMLMVGDTSGIADMGVGLGSLLLSSAYSRHHESEADRYAFDHMLLSNIDPIAFSTIMNRMTDYMNSPNESKKLDNNILDYLSSHPTTQDRVEIARKYSECFKNGLKKCVFSLDN